MFTVKIAEHNGEFIVYGVKEEKEGIYFLIFDDYWSWVESEICVPIYQ